MKRKETSGILENRSPIKGRGRYKKNDEGCGKLVGGGVTEPEEREINAARPMRDTDTEQKSNL